VCVVMYAAVCGSASALVSSLLPISSQISNVLQCVFQRVCV